MNTQNAPMNVNLPKIIRILRESLYSDPNVAIRELIQNANDSCEKRRAFDENIDPLSYVAKAHFRFNVSDRTLSVEDNGKGLKREELKYLTEIGTSETEEARELLRSTGKHESAERLIGRFGLGLLSTLIIADNITFDTLAFGDTAEPIKWYYEGEQESYISEGSRTSIGTTVTIKVKLDYVHILNERFLTQLIRLYGDLLNCEFYLNEIDGPLNSMKAPWDTNASKDEYMAFVKERFGESMLDVIPVNFSQQLETGEHLKIGGVLFIPRQTVLVIEEHGKLVIYSSRMLVKTDEQRLLPDWAKFLDGVIESPNFNVPLSREALIQDEIFYRIKTILGDIITNYMVELHNGDRKLFRRIVKSHGVIIKTWAIAADELFIRVKDTVVFRTDDETLTLPEYFAKVEQLKGGPNSDGKKYIYYTSTLEGASHIISLFKMQGLLVIDASSFPDASFLLKYGDWHSDVELKKLETDNDFIFESIELTDAWEALEQTYERIVGIKAKVVRFIPDYYPAVLILNEPEVTSNQLEDLLEGKVEKSLQDMLIGMIKSHEELMEEQKILQGVLYINSDNYMITRLVTLDLGDSEIVEVLRAIYFNALLLSMQGAKRVLRPENAREIFETTNRAFSSLINNIYEVRRLRAKGAEVAMTVQDTQKTRTPKAALKHILCFVAIPFKRDYDLVMDVIREVFETAPYFWEVRRADEKYFSVTIPNNISEWIDQSHCYIAEITELNDNVMMELGYMYWAYPNRPLLIFQQSGAFHRLADLDGYLRVVYPWQEGITQKETSSVVEALRKEISKFDHIQELNNSKQQRFLSEKTLLKLNWLAPHLASTIAENFDTVENFLSSDDAFMMKKLGLPAGAGMINDVKNFLRDHCGL